MRLKVLVLVLVLGTVGLASQAHAEKVRTNQAAKVTNRPGEQGKVLVRLKEGQVVTVIEREGRWLKVRVAGRTGYLPRTVVDLEGDDEADIPRNTRRRPFVDGRSKRRGLGGADSAPEDRIGADATGDDDGGGEDPEDAEPDDDDDGERGGKRGADARARRSGGGEDAADAADAADEDADTDDEDADAEDADAEDVDAEDAADEDADEDEIVDTRRRARVTAKRVAYTDPDGASDEAFTAKPGDVLYIESTEGTWTEVSVEDGDIGWILTSQLEMEDGGGGGGGLGRRAIDVRARLGVTFFRQSLLAAGGVRAWPDDYTLGSSAVSVALGGTYLVPYKKRFLVGGELTYDLARAVPGVSYQDATTGITLHNLNVRGLLGYDLAKRNGLTVFGRLGFHYDSFLVANVTDLAKNTAQLPSEVFFGPAIGAAVALPRLTDKIGLRFSVDTMLVGSTLTQTKNLEDGEDPKAKRVTIGAALSYRWKPGLDISAGYDLTYASVAFGAPIPTSLREHMGTSVARTDLQQMVTVGLAKAF